MSRGLLFSSRNASVCLFLALVLPICSSCRCGGEPNETVPPQVHMFTWRAGHRPTDAWSTVRYFLDGKDLGIGREALACARSVDLKKGSTVFVMIPDDEDPFYEQYCPPYVDSGLVNSWIERNVVLKYYFQGKELEVHTLAWQFTGRMDPEEEFQPFGSPEEMHEYYERQSRRGREARYFYDGKEVGVGDKGVAGLWKIRLQKGVCLQLVSPEVQTLSGPGEGHPPSALGPLLEQWEADGVRLELLLERDH